MIFQALEQRLVTKMNAVVPADGNDAATEALAQVPTSANELHER
jgi:hypothetical protein